jgi:DNA polymerase (family 10)
MMTPSAVASKLHDISFLFQVLGENRFKAVAFDKAADSIKDLSSFDSVDIRSMKGIGSAIADAIEQLIATGTCDKIEKLSKNAPPISIKEFTRLPKIGPAGAKKIWETYKIISLEELGIAIHEKRVMDKKLIEGLALIRKQSERIPLYEVLPYVENFIQELKIKCPLIQSIDTAGSLRRKRETIKDIDLLVGVKEDDREALIESLRSNFNVIEGGDKKMYIDVEWGSRTQRIDLNLTTPESFWAYLNHLTGSKQFNIAMRALALTKGFSINQYWVEDKNGDKIYLTSEEHLFDLLGIPFVPPECRETGEEIGKDFSNLVTWEDLCTDLHIHSDVSDGKPMEEVIASAKNKFNIIGITDHSHSTFGLKAEELTAYAERVRSFSSPDFKVYAGVEMDTRKSGKLDYSDEEVACLDYVIIAAHRQPGENLEERYITAMRAISKPKIIAHPTCRILGQREEAKEVRWHEIFQVAKETDTALEINAQPSRIDLPWNLIRRAKEYGLKFSINSDQHETDFDYMRYALNEARKGLLTKEDLFRL